MNKTKFGLTAAHLRILALVLMLLVFVCTGIMNRFGADEEGGVIA